MFISKLKNPSSGQVWETMVISDSHMMGKDAQEKNKICSLQRKRTGPSEGTEQSIFF
jgi:hypothetical protein